MTDISSAFFLAPRHAEVEGLLDISSASFVDSQEPRPTHDELRSACHRDRLLGRLSIFSTPSVLLGSGPAGYFAPRGHSLLRLVDRSFLQRESPAPVSASCPLQWTSGFSCWLARPAFWSSLPAVAALPHCHSTAQSSTQSSSTASTIPVEDSTFGWPVTETEFKNQI